MPRLQGKRGTITLLTSIQRCRRCGGAGVLRGGAGKGVSIHGEMKIRRGVIAPDGEISFEYVVVCRDD
jgi:hypothetical protein